MSMIRKLIANKVLVKVQKRFGSSRTLHLTAAELDDRNVIKSDGEVFIPELTIPEIIVPKLQAYKNYTAVVCAETGKQYTYQQLGDKTYNLSKSLRKILKLQKGDKVAIVSKNSPDYFVSAFGVLRSGLIITTLNPLYTPDEMSYQLGDADVKIIMAQVSLCANVKQALAKLKKQIPIIAIKENESDSLPEGTINFEELINAKVDFPDIELGKHDDITFLPYSSGTTGLPKGVELTHKNLLSNLFQTLHPSYCILESPSESYQNQIPVVLPMYHIYGFTVGMLIALFHGSKIIALPKFTPQLYINVLDKYDITHIYAAPPLVLFLTYHPQVKAEHFKHLKVLMSGAAPLGYTDEIQIREKLKNDNIMINQGYGLTETSPLISVAPKGYRTTEETGGTIGTLVPNTAAKIISTENDSGTALGPNTKGELLVKGPQVMRAYYNRPEETAKSFMSGWFRTGDIGYFNENGFLFITDRLKELIKVKGFQVPPAELEAVIRTHPDIEDAGVVGIPHPTHGEVPRAYVVPKNKDKFNVKLFQEFVASKVAKYKQLAGGVQIIDAIPRNPSGKILRRHLKDQFLAKGI